MDGNGASGRDGRGRVGCKGSEMRKPQVDRCRRGQARQIGERTSCAGWPGAQRPRPDRFAHG